MIKYYTQIYILAKHAGVKPQTDFGKILTSLGAKPLALSNKIVTNRLLYYILNFFNWIISWLFMPSNKIVVLQYPVQRGLATIFKRAKRKNNKVIVIVHDLNEIRTAIKDKYQFILEDSDALILHTPQMAEWAKKRYNIKGDVIILNIFDYLLPKNTDEIHPKSKSDTYKIAFCGNLAKAEFIEKLNLPDNIELILYGINCTEKMKHIKGIKYMGAVLPDELPDLIQECDFGLVWDGTDVNQCSGNMGRYLCYNAPFKLSLYLASGLPVIIWNKMGVADYLNKIGVSISLNSLEELSSLISSMELSKYSELQNAANECKKKIVSGNMGIIALTKAIEKVSN